MIEIVSIGISYKTAPVRTEGLGEDAQSVINENIPQDGSGSPSLMRSFEKHSGPFA